MAEKLAVLDISESGAEIGRKLFILLDEKQKLSLTQFAMANLPVMGDTRLSSSNYFSLEQKTERQHGELFFCLEDRFVSVQGHELQLTIKEFDILALLVLNPQRVFTYEMIMDLIWHEEYNFYSRKAINNHVGKLRKKLKFSNNTQNYIKNIAGVGYKFEVK